MIQTRPGSVSGKTRAQVSERTDEVRRAAATLFAERGYSATTMNQIADATGLFPGSLYHHFASKEDIAVAILDQFNNELDSLDSALVRADAVVDPVEQLCKVFRDVSAVSLGNAAAIRLRVFEPPTVASPRLASARALDAPTLGRAWKEGVGRLAEDTTVRARNAGLLRFTLNTLALDAGAHFPGYGDADHLATVLCESMLNGVTIECPTDDELTSSDAFRAAHDAVASWPSNDLVGRTSDVKTRVIAAARAQFASKGYHATTIRDIAEVAGVQMATLYRRIESKEAILSEVVETFSHSLDIATRAALTTGDSEAASLDALASVFIAARRRFREESDIVRLAPASDVTQNPLTRYAKETDERLDLLKSLLARGMDKGTVRAFDTPEAIAPHIRYVLWVPFQDYARTSNGRSREFVRDTLLRGYLNS